MSNVDIDFDTIDYSTGNATMAALYNERTVVSATWEDFLKLPKVAGYENNVKRVPNDFSTNVIDKKGDPYRTINEQPIISDSKDNLKKE